MSKSVYIHKNSLNLVNKLNLLVFHAGLQYACFAAGISRVRYGIWPDGRGQWHAGRPPDYTRHILECSGACLR